MNSAGLTEQELAICLEACEAYGNRGCVCGHSAVKHKDKACKEAGCTCTSYTARPSFDEILSRATPGYGISERNAPPAMVRRYHNVLVPYCLGLLVAWGAIQPYFPDTDDK